ncbi:MAG TPA: Mu transposase C-terminal domain-containing protein [Pyrinomonadaceae bacterium]|jgi:hypothetical protein|nr:Mu transposase C-terminal domain-containing protein [Pyrinomonadaceae bacterium]
MNLFVNTLIEWHTPDDEQSKSYVERILMIDAFLTEIITINILDKRALPIARSYSEVVHALAANEARILQIDPYVPLLRPEDEIKENHLRRRDEAWGLIESLVANEDRAFLLNKKIRGRLIANLSITTSREKKVIYKFLRRYWQAGRIKNALLPTFNNCGGPGKRRLAITSDSPKLGRPSALAKATGQSIGIRLTADIEKRFERGIKRFYEKEKAGSLRRAYQLTLETFFNEGYALTDGTLVPILPPAEKLPSFKQFRDWYRKIYRDIVREKKARQGDREYNLCSRELLGDSTQMAFGPGSVYQIDATLADIYLVSSFDRTRIIGRPVIYVCIDVFSRVITGICVTLEGPSWLGAMLALDNVMANKATFCLEYGVSLQEDEWPCHHLPEAILADRGEFEGYNANSLVNSLGTRIHNAPPYRADWKGIVERHFGIVNESFIHFLPGTVYPPRTRGNPDYRLDAVLTINEFRKLLILYVRDYNMNHYMKWYRKNVFMIADHVARYPLDIWHWGIRNRSGHLRTRSQDIVRLNLLPRKQVSVTSRGIHFEKELYYTCDTALREGWFIRARTQGSWKIVVCYDPRTLNTIYMSLEGGRQLESCHLTPACQTFQDHDWHEAIDYFALETQAEECSHTRIHHSQSTLHAQHNQLVSEATEKTESAHVVRGKQSKRARTKGIRDNRLSERQSEQSRTAWDLLTDSKGAQSTATQEDGLKVNARNIDEEEYIPPSSKVNKIRTLRDKGWKKHA